MQNSRVRYSCWLSFLVLQLLNFIPGFWPSWPSFVRGRAASSVLNNIIKWSLTELSVTAVSTTQRRTCCGGPLCVSCSVSWYKEQESVAPLHLQVSGLGFKEQFHQNLQNKITIFNSIIIPANLSTNQKPTFSK